MVTYGGTIYNMTKYEKIHENVLQGKKRIAKVVKFTKSSLV